jgi:hypothetical protein
MKWELNTERRMKLVAEDRYMHYIVVGEHFLCSCLLGLLAPVMGGLSMYVRDLLAIGKRGEI